MPVPHGEGQKHDKGAGQRAPHPAVLIKSLLPPGLDGALCSPPPASLLGAPRGSLPACFPSFECRSCHTVLWLKKEQAAALCELCQARGTAGL